jgi:hypothetical protein
MLKPTSFKPSCESSEGLGPWILTYSGVKVHLLNPLEDEILVQDIVHALSNLCRFVGHTRKFYSVAEHSIRVADLLPKELKLWGLLHDASEAYISDMSRPLKAQLALYRDVEEKIMRTIANKFNLVWPMPAEVKHADTIMLATEAMQLTSRPELWVPELTVEPLSKRISPMTSEQAKQAFQDDLTKELRFNYVV